MKVFVYGVVIAIYLAALFYLLLGALGFSLGVRIAGNTFVDEGLRGHSRGRRSWRFVRDKKVAKKFFRKLLKGLR